MRYRARISAGLVGAATALSVLASPVAGQQAADWDLSRDWDITLGGGGSLEPTYEGSNNVRPIPLPYFDIEWNDRLSVALGDGLHFAPLKLGDLTLGLAGDIRLPRRPSDDRTLKKLNSVGLSLEVGGYIDYNPRGFDASLEIRHDIAGGHGGSIAELSLRGQMEFDQSFGIEFGPNLTWADRKYMRSYFGITSAEAARSGYLRYRPDAGFKDIGFTVESRLLLGKHWRLLSRFEYDYLLGDAAQSPIVKGRGARNQMSFSLALAYRF